jgi:protein-S-isoprenylcysteine O-methyltransferase Ste14
MQPQPRSFTWGKVAGIVFAVIIPGVLVIVANYTVFPDASWLATGMVITTMGMAIIFAVASAFATPKVKRYVLIAAFAIDLVLAGNLALHWVLARQISGTKQATTARHEDEDRADKRAEATAQRQKDLIAAETKRFNAEAWRNAEARKLGVQAPRGARLATSAATAPTAEATTAVSAPADKPQTIDQVMATYTPWLLGFAIAELLTSIVAFGICALLWEWDLNGDGIDDNLQQPKEQEVNWPNQVGK